jgi:hypothetical protein
MPGYLLSDHVGFVVRLDFEAAVVGPEVDGNADASDTALVDLPRVSPIFGFVYTGDLVLACGLELRLRPPSCASAARTSFSQCSNSSGSDACISRVSA